VRTTVTLDPDTEALVKRLMQERGISFKQAVNQAIRAGLTTKPGETPVETPTFRMGFRPEIPWDKALSLTAELEDDELVRRLATRR
jgi:hypothetical protein